MTLTLEQVAGWLLKQDAELNGRVTVGAIDANLHRRRGLHPIRLQAGNTACALDNESRHGRKEGRRAV